MGPSYVIGLLRSVQVFTAFSSGLTGGSNKKVDGLRHGPFGQAKGKLDMAIFMSSFFQYSRVGAFSGESTPMTPKNLVSLFYPSKHRLKKK